MVSSAASSPPIGPGAFARYVQGYTNMLVYITEKEGDSFKAIDSEYKKYTIAEIALTTAQSNETFNLTDYFASISDDDDDGNDESESEEDEDNTLIAVRKKQNKLFKMQRTVLKQCQSVNRGQGTTKLSNEDLEAAIELAVEQVFEGLFKPE